MKKTVLIPFVITAFFFVLLLISGQPAKGQDTSKTSSFLPEEIHKIVSVSCFPCHTSDGGLMSKSKLNFTVWNNYSPEKQKEKAAKMFAEINKGSMPPKKAREQKPEIIPTKDQTEIIKKWSESFPTSPK